MYTIKGLKTFIGNEGHGYNVTLCRDGKKVAFVIDDASGGEVDFQWLDYEPGKRVSIEAMNYKGEPFTRGGTPEEAKLYAFLKGKMSPPCFEGDTESQTTPEEFVGSLIDDHEIDKKMRGLCKKYLLIRITGDAEDEYRTVKQKDSPGLRTALAMSVARDGKEIIEFINDKYGAAVCQKT